MQTMELQANSSNNTIFADADGDIAYFHGNFIPKRDTNFDWTKPVDGSNPATEWQGLLSIDETPHLLNPKSGWLYNCNNWPWSAAGPSSPKKEDYPAYVESGGESARGLHAIRVLQDKKDFTLDSLIAAAYDSYLTWFEKPMPALIKAWDATPDSNPLKAKLAEQIGLSAQVGSPLGSEIRPHLSGGFLGRGCRSGASAAAEEAGGSGDDPFASAPPEQLLQALAAASDKLAADFGSWKTPWGDINRFQRINDDIAPAVQRRGTEHSRRLHFRDLGLAGLFRGARLSGHEEVVRHQRQQLRRRGGVRRDGERQGRDGRRRERQPGVQALQRSGQALQHGRAAGRLLLPRATEGTHRAGVSSRKLSRLVTLPGRRAPRGLPERIRDFSRRKICQSRSNRKSGSQRIHLEISEPPPSRRTGFRIRP